MLAASPDSVTAARGSRADRVATIEVASEIWLML